MSGADVRKLILDSGVMLWQVAAALGCNDGNFSRKLRGVFTEEEVATIKRIIIELQK